MKHITCEGARTKCKQYQIQESCNKALNSNKSTNQASSRKIDYRIVQITL